MWKYSQTDGRLYRPDGVLAGHGYAGGDGGLRPEGINNHAMQSIHNVGPLPCGIYKKSTPVEHSHLGPLAIPLIPMDGNEMFGRSGFYMHGDRASPPKSASDGCIIMAHSVRVEFSDSSEQWLEVVEAV